MTKWDMFARQPSPAPGMAAELARLRAALPGYDVTVISCSGQYRYEAVRRDGGTGPWCVVSTDPADVWRELAAHVRPGSRPEIPGTR